MLIKLLRGIMDPHSQLAARLLRLVPPPRTNDPDESKDGFEAAAVIVFLAGVDKLLSLSLELLYLAGHVKWRWMKEGRRESNVLPAQVFCGPGFTAKIAKLNELGCDLTELCWLSEARNNYVHECNIFAGYRIHPDFERKRLALKATGPVVESSGPLQLGWRPEGIDTMTTALVDRLGSFLIDRHCEEGLRQIAERVAKLSDNPEPWTTRLREASDDPDRVSDIMEELNATMVGKGLVRLLSSAHF
jgi:hypothetical protein